jgi:hypothetical protein
MRSSTSNFASLHPAHSGPFSLRGPLSLRPCRAQDNARRCQIACSSWRGNFQPKISRSIVIGHALTLGLRADVPTPAPYRVSQAGEGSCTKTNVRRGLRAASTSGTSRLGSAEPRAANRIVSPRQHPAQPVFVAVLRFFDDSLPLLLNDRLLLSDPMSLHAARANSATSLKPAGWRVMNSRRFMCGWPLPGKRSFGVQHTGLSACVSSCSENSRNEFRTIQVSPKDLRPLPGHPEPAVSWHSGFRGGAYARPQTAPVPDAARRRGGVAAHGAGAAAGDAGHRVSQHSIA